MSKSQVATEAAASLTQMLSCLLADVHTLYIKTLGCHWNVEDQRFLMLHELFEQQYTQLAQDLDTVAERIRMLGERAPASVKSLSDLSRLSDTDELQDASAMIKALITDYDALIGQLRKDIAEADELGDPGTADMLTAMVQNYEKALWFLRSHKV